MGPIENSNTKTKQQLRKNTKCSWLSPDEKQRTDASQEDSSSKPPTINILRGTLWRKRIKEKRETMLMAAIIKNKNFCFSTPTWKSLSRTELIPVNTYIIRIPEAAKKALHRFF